MAALVPCVDSFIQEFLFDIGIPQSGIDNVVKYSNIAIDTYEMNRPKVTPNDIIVGLYSCSRQESNKIIKDIAREVSLLQISLSVIIIIVAIIIACSFVLTAGSWRIAIIVFLILVTVIAIYSLYIRTISSISTLLDNLETNLTVCSDNASSQFVTYENTQIAAVNSALCAYANQSST